MLPEAEKSKKRRTKKPGVNLKDLFDAFAARDLIMPPLVKGEDKIAGQMMDQFGADVVADFWQDVGNGVWPQNDHGWLRNSRSFGTLSTRIVNWLESRQNNHAEPAPTGKRLRTVDEALNGKGY